MSPALKKPRARPVSAGPTAAAAEAIAKVTPARAAAFAILTLVAEGKGHSDELLHSERTETLSPEDRNLATALVMGVLRWEIALDAQLRGLLARPDQRLAEPVALALRMGAFQLLHMDRIPAHAALSESVEMCRAAGHPHAAGMVNAVLRKLAALQPTAKQRDAGKRDAGQPVSQRPLYESTAAFAERLGHPRWLAERWVAAYGREAALAICEYDQREPAAGTMFAPAGDAPHDLPQMDDGSRLVAEISAAAAPVPHGRPVRVWDCCAAPGGKTLVLAARLAGAEVLASDVSAKRMAQMEARLLRYGYAANVRCAVADAADSNRVPHPSQSHRDGWGIGSAEQFDLVLCDVPCSGTGTLARNPEIRHRLREEELARQADRQRAILRAALKRLAPAGRLVYSTCSLEAEENERVVEAVGAGFRTVPVQELIAALAKRGTLREDVAEMLLKSATREGALRTLPGVHPCDGFYAVVLERL